MPANPGNLVWIDLEMTGLDPDSCYIMEIATLVTTADLELVAEGPNLVIHCSNNELQSLSDWCRNHFGKSGLIDRVRASGVSCADAEKRTIEFLKKHVQPGNSPLCGNSVHNDRAFLWRHMRSLHDFCHYRNVDVSSLKVLLQSWYRDRYSPPPKKETHEALTDIRESVAELRYYRDNFLIPRK